jgi:hypothetical protein
LDHGIVTKMIVIQIQRFSEPAWFLIRGTDQLIHYVDYASSPVGGRPNPDSILMAYQYVLERAAKEPDTFGKFKWGVVVPQKL